MMTMSMKMMTVMMMMMKMMEMVMMMTMNDDDDDYDDDDFNGGGNGDDVLHDETVKDNASSRFLFVHTCVVFFSPVVIKLCACLFLDPVSHYLQKHTRPFWIFYNDQVVFQVWCFRFSIWIYSCS